MNKRGGRDAYANAIEKVRSAHHNTIAPVQTTVECPKCGTKQVIAETPGMRVCVKCGFEFKPMNQRR